MGAYQLDLSILNPPTPKNINNRLSRISANEQIFLEAIPKYQDALDASGFNYKLKYDPNIRNNNGNNRRTRTRKVTWYNPPYSANVETNIGKIFLQMIKELFPPHHKLYKIINKNTVKLSYRCMPNMRRIISQHNNKILNPPQQAQEYTCNCRDKSECPLPDQCTIDKVQYKSTVTTEDPQTVETYVGVTATSFKKRFGGHKTSFNNPKYAGDTMLSTHIWNLKKDNINYNMKWSINRQDQPYSHVTGVCRFCLGEKHEILFNLNPGQATLNQRSEFYSHCRHKDMDLLSRVKT